jgi:DNA polymerase (family 10)
LRAIECPWVDILAHPTGRRILRRDPSRAKMETVFEAALRHGVTVEVNCQPERLDLDDILARRARDRGVSIVIDTDAHSPTALGNLRWGVMVARRAWLEPRDVINTRTFEELRASLRRHRHSGAPR